MPIVLLRADATGFYASKITLPLQIVYSTFPLGFCPKNGEFWDFD